MKVFSMNKFMNSEIVKNLSDEYLAELSEYDGQPIEKIKKEDLKFIPESALIEKEEYDAIRSEKENTAELIIKALVRTLSKYNCPKETVTEIILDFMKEFIKGDKNKDDDHISIKVVEVNK